MKKPVVKKIQKQPSLKIKKPKKEEVIKTPHLHQPEPVTPAPAVAPQTTIKPHKNVFYQGNEILKVFGEKVIKKTLFCEVKDPNGNILRMFIPVSDFEKAEKKLFEENGQ